MVCELREVGVIYLGIDPVECEIREEGVIYLGVDPMVCELREVGVIYLGVDPIIIAPGPIDDLHLISIHGFCEHLLC